MEKQQQHSIANTYCSSWDRHQLSTDGGGSDGHDGDDCYDAISPNSGSFSFFFFFSGVTSFPLESKRNCAHQTPAQQ